MHTTEMIRRFPEAPEHPILFVVYNDDMVAGTKTLIDIIHGSDYCDRYCTVVSLNTKVDDHSMYDVYIDPTVYTYMHSWNN